jgi:asparagine synthase (glutamine-hydrolysing)
MAGWLVILGPEELLERGRGALTACAERDSGASLDFRTGRGWLIGVWRRERGEFPRSGTLLPARDGVLAWLGQTVGDAGDTSPASIGLVGGGADDAGLAGLNGPWAAAIAGDFGAAVVTDRYRHYPVYVHRDGPTLVAGTDIRAVAACIREPEVDRESLGLLLRSGELIDRMTMVRGVELLPPATVLEVRNGRATERRYWLLRHNAHAGASFGKLVGEIGDALKASVRRIETASPSLGITLSGGLDSRFILGLCGNPSRVPSFTWGEPGCRDIECAKAFAKRVGSPHTVRHWEPEAFPPVWGEGAELTAGSFGVESMYMMPFVGLLQGHADVILNGLAGDAFLGGNFLKLSWMKETDTRRLAEASWRWRVSEEQEAVADSLLGKGVEAGREAWIGSIAAEGGGRPVDRLNDWLYENRVFRNTNSGTMLLRRGVESHAPFFDNDVADLLLRTPHEFKFKHRLYLAVMKRACPAAAAVTWQRTGIPPSWGFAANTGAMAFHRVARAAGKKVGIDPFPKLAVADTAAWFRGPWRSAAAAILLDERTLSRGLVEPDAVRKLLQEHHAGANRTRQLGVLIAVELFCRRVLDHDTPAGGRAREVVGAVAG